MALSAEERRLVEGCRRGDERAWLTVYRAHSGDIGLYLGGMLYDQAEVDDLVQRVFLEFLSSLERFRGDAGLRTWLHAIARRVASRAIRSRTRRRRHLQDYARTVEAHGVTAEPQVVARGQLTRIKALLGELDPARREVWVLRELNQLDVAEVAAIVGIPPATVRTRHHRARRRLLALLGADEADLDPRAKRPVLALVERAGGR